MIGVQAVTFDFWNTLVRDPGDLFSRLRTKAVLDACAREGLAVSQAELAAALTDVGAQHHAAWTDGRVFAPRDAGAALVRGLGLPSSAHAGVTDAFLEAGRGAELELAPDAAEVVRALGERGVRLGIVCDVGFTGGEQLRGFLRTSGLLDWFGAWAFSDELGRCKPAPEVFHHVLEQLGTDPARAVHIGDLRRTDVAGARAAGMRTIRYRGLHDDRERDFPDADEVVDSHSDLQVLLIEAAA
jgi:FMN phosphatase YigB (HAD superfamily)